MLKDFELPFLNDFFLLNSMKNFEISFTVKIHEKSKKNCNSVQICENSQKLFLCLEISLHQIEIWYRRMEQAKANERTGGQRHAPCSVVVCCVLC